MCERHNEQPRFIASKAHTSGSNTSESRGFCAGAFRGSCDRNVNGAPNLENPADTALEISVEPTIQSPAELDPGGQLETMLESPGKPTPQSSPRNAHGYYS